MLCPKCNCSLPSGAKFCPECGHKIEQTVNACPNSKCVRTNLPPEAKFCPDCGSKLNFDQNASTDFINDSGTFIDDRDGRKYKWIKIGGQIWMAENLAYHLEEGCWVFEDERKNFRKYGYLYNWESAEEACPKGWHLPTQEEWDELTDFLMDNGDYYDSDDEDSIAKALASTKGWHESNEEGTPGNSPEENNSTGFNGKPGGWFDSDEYEYNLDEWYGCWWTATEDEDDESQAYYRELIYNKNYLDESYENKEFGYSVRCIKD